MAKWEQLIRRDEILTIWMKLYEDKNKKLHDDLAKAIDQHIKTNHTDIDGIIIDKKRLTTVCEQIRAGMLKQLDKAKERNPNPTEYERTMWAKAENKIPQLLYGAKDTSRTDYGLIFGNLLNDIQNENR